MDRKKQDKMHIAVCVKPIPDPNIVSLDAKNCLDEEDLVYILNPCDMVAVEEAVRLKEKRNAESVTVLSITPPSGEGLLRRCLAIGADRAVRLWDASFNEIYNDATGIVLACLIRHISFDLVLCGQKASDDEMGFTGYVIAAQLGIPFIQKAVNMEMSQHGKIMVTSKLEGGNREMIEASLPVVVGIEADLNEPRYASLPPLIAALRKQIEQYALKTIGLSEKDVCSKIEFTGFSPPRPRPKKLFIPESNLSAADRLRLIMSGGMEEKKEELFEGSPEELSQKCVQFLSQINIIKTAKIKSEN